ncbi:hypothetical protein GA0061101_11557 [Rhizobium lusitanum]|uniref:Uncharacterized protein n=1 Tax=Rhizobium lusitanum TaxID=293958 RepID=A0A1C3WQL7_9HYPH|nr:hypothetical protein GA0061101_11557 [Rhizobium lusitanum]
MRCKASMPFIRGIITSRTMMSVGGTSYANTGIFRRLNLKPFLYKIFAEKGRQLTVVIDQKYFRHIRFRVHFLGTNTPNNADRKKFYTTLHFLNVA